MSSPRRRALLALLPQAFAPSLALGQTITNLASLPVLFQANVQGSRREIARVMDKHSAEYQGLKPMVDYFEASFPSGGRETPAALACPE